MADKASFDHQVEEDATTKFAFLSGDWNPLHTDVDYAIETEYGKPVLHGAYSAGLISRMAGMHIPGESCLLHGMTLRFVRPIIPPAQVTVTGTLDYASNDMGKVNCRITDTISGVCYVEGFYTYGHHRHKEGRQLVGPQAEQSDIRRDEGDGVVLVTGATGGLGKAMLNCLGQHGFGLSGSGNADLMFVPDLKLLDPSNILQSVRAIVHCAWPAVDPHQFTQLDDPGQMIDRHVAEPLKQIQNLAHILLERGTPDAALILVGSTYAVPGRHNFRLPLYSIAKSMIPTLAQILALELGIKNKQKCVGIIFDVLDGGMNASLSSAAKISHMDRTPTGRIGTMDEAAEQIAWLLKNSSHLISGATINASGGAIP